eukprot:6095226-Pyramimonas_sp.AAC.1
MAFRSDVIGAALSGLTALVLSASQVARIESTCLRYLRVLLGGVATRIEVVSPDASQTTVIRTPPAEVLWRQSGLVPIELELRVQRLKEWQKIARSPAYHVQQLTAVFGALDVEAAVPSLVARYPSACSSPKDTSRDNPWANQFVQDLHYMACAEEGRDALALLVDEASEVDFLGIFRGGSEAYDAFQKIDMQQFRAEWLVRPSSSSDISPEPGEAAEGEYCRTYLNDDGLECGRRYVSHRALLVHQRQAAGGQHGIPSAISKL